MCNGSCSPAERCPPASSLLRAQQPPSPAPPGTPASQLQERGGGGSTAGEGPAARRGQRGDGDREREREGEKERKEERGHPIAWVVPARSFSLLRVSPVSDPSPHAQHHRESTDLFLLRVSGLYKQLLSLFRCPGLCSLVPGVLWGGWVQSWWVRAWGTQAIEPLPGVPCSFPNGDAAEPAARAEWARQPAAPCLVSRRLFPTAPLCILNLDCRTNVKMHVCECDALCASRKPQWCLPQVGRCQRHPQSHLSPQV